MFLSIGTSYIVNFFRHQSHGLLLDLPRVISGSEFHTLQLLRRVRSNPAMLVKGAPHHTYCLLGRQVMRTEVTSQGLPTHPPIWTAKLFCTDKFSRFSSYLPILDCTDICLPSRCTVLTAQSRPIRLKLSNKLSVCRPLNIPTYFAHFPLTICIGVDVDCLAS